MYSELMSLLQYDVLNTVNFKCSMLLIMMVCKNVLHQGIVSANTTALLVINHVSTQLLTI